MADVQVVYQLIIQGEDAQETMDGLTESAEDAQGALGGLNTEAAGVGEGVEGALPAVTGLATGIGSMAKTGRTSTKVMSGLAAAVQGVSPAAANALRGMSGLTRAFTAGGAALGAYAVALAPVLVAVAAAALVYRQLAAAVKEAEEKMATAAENTERVVAAHQQLTQGLADVETQLKLINGEIDQFELGRIQGTERLEEAFKAQIEFEREAIKAARERATVAQQTLDDTLEARKEQLAGIEQIKASGGELLDIDREILELVRLQEKEAAKAATAVAFHEERLKGVNERLEGGRKALAKNATLQREAADAAKSEADERERAAEAAKAQAEQAKKVAEYKAQQAQIDEQIRAAGLDPVELGLELKADPAFLEAIQEFAAALAQPSALRPDGVTGVDPGLARLREELDTLIPPEAITTAERLGLVQAELSTMLLRGRISAEEYAAAMERTTEAQKRAALEAEVAAAQQSKEAVAVNFDEMLSGSLNRFSTNLITGTGDILSSWADKLDEASQKFADAGSFMESGLKGLLQKGAGGAAGLGGKALGAMGGVLGAITETVKVLVSIGSAALAMKEQLQAAKDSGDEETVRAIESAIRQAGSEGSAAMSERISGFFERLGEGIASLPTLLLVGLPKAILEGSLHLVVAILRLPIEILKGLVTLFNPGTWIDFFRDLFGELWSSIWTDIKELFNLFDGSGKERREERRAERRGEDDSDSSSSRTTSSSSSSSARSSQQSVEEAVAAELLSLLSGRRLPGGMSTAAGGPLRRQFARFQQAGGLGGREGAGGGITVNTVMIDPNTAPLLGQTIDKAGKSGRYPKMLGG